MNCKHKFKSHYDGTYPTANGGSRMENYSQCEKCGLQTRTYRHGDFEDMAKAESEARAIDGR